MNSANYDNDENTPMSLLTPEIKGWIGRSEAPVTVEVSRREIQKYAVATEQIREAYLLGDEAPPMFVFGLFRPVVPIRAGPPGANCPRALRPIAVSKLPR